MREEDEERKEEETNQKQAPTWKDEDDDKLALRVDFPFLSSLWFGNSKMIWLFLLVLFFLGM